MPPGGVSYEGSDCGIKKRTYVACGMCSGPRIGSFFLLSWTVESDACVDKWGVGDPSFLSRGWGALWLVLWAPLIREQLFAI